MGVKENKSKAILNNNTTITTNTKKTNWYKEAVVYQVYPLSFADSNNDGMGDIPGIISKLDYLKELGITAIWFSPLYPSPWKDYGYDIADYKNIHPAFGTLDDFDDLVSACHERDIRVIMDAVFNHTSDQHEWFKAALADKDSPYRDYYIIRPGRRIKVKKPEGKFRWHRGATRPDDSAGSSRQDDAGYVLLPPTNWKSAFTGSAWERIGSSDEFYLHLFAPEQPDLNWENPKVREEMADVLRFWMERGVDGFRFDVFNLVSKVYPLRDDKNPLRFQKGTPYYVDGPRMHEFLRELNEKALALYDTYTVGESYIPDEEHARRYIHEESGELDTIFDFEHLTSDNVGGSKFIPRPFSLRRFKRGLIDPQLKYHGTGWNTLVLENHDNIRSVSRFGINTGKYRYEAATFLPLITFMGWGTPFIYQGEEIGMTNSVFGSLDDLKDPVSHFVYDTVCNMHMPQALAAKLIMDGARDHARTPMQWSSSVNAGFNEGTGTWQSVNPNYKDINVEKDLSSEKSIFRFYKKLIEIKKSERVLIYGDTVEYYPDDGRIIAYSRSYEDRRFFVIGNFSGRKKKCILPPDFEPSELVVRLANYDRTIVDRELTLKPYEAILLEEI